jgi:hypothetical protein
VATKPATQPTYWATDAVYTTGPFIGQPQKVIPPAAAAAEGHRPGSLFPTPAEYENSQQYNITGLARWVFAGSSAGAADAHICETDSNGEGQVERWRVRPANPHSYALFVEAPPGAGFAVQATGGSALGDATIISETTGTGAAFEALSATAGASFLSNRSGTGHGLEVTHAGSGNAVDLDVSGGTGGAIVALGNATATCVVITGGAGQAAIIGISGNNAPSAVGAIGTGTAIGLDATGGDGSAAATGVRGSAVHADASGVYGRSAAAASTTGTGVTAEGRGSGAGLRAIAAAFHAAIFQGDSTSPLFAAVRFMGVDARPTNATAGSLDYSNTENQIIVGDSVDNAYRGVWATTGGKVTAYTASASGAQNVAQTSGQVNWITAAVCEATGGNAPKVSGREAVLRFRCTAKCVTSPGAGGAWLSVRLVDGTGGGAGVPLPGALRSGTGNLSDISGYFLEDNLNWQTSVVFDFRFTPGSGDRIYWAQIRSNQMTEIRVRDCSLTLDGLF